jgi:probable phosphoglycerate mutase
MTTARTLAQPLHLEPLPLEGLIDIDYGRLQGLSLEEAEATEPQLYAQWLDKPHQVTFPEGENLTQVRDRAVAAIQGLLPSHQKDTIALVSHKVVCKVLMCHFLGMDISRFWQVDQHTCGINQVDIAASSETVVLLNDTCHLRDLA